MLNNSILIWKLWDMVCGLVRIALNWELGCPNANCGIFWTTHLAFLGFIFSLLTCRIGLDQWISTVPQGSTSFLGLHGEWSCHQRSHGGGWGRGWGGGRKKACQNSSRVGLEEIRRWWWESFVISYNSQQGSWGKQFEMNPPKRERFQK